jgi:hypothetical protein
LSLIFSQQTEDKPIKKECAPMDDRSRPKISKTAFPSSQEEQISSSQELGSKETLSQLSQRGKEELSQESVSQQSPAALVSLLSSDDDSSKVSQEVHQGPCFPFQNEFWSTEPKPRQTQCPYCLLNINTSRISEHTMTCLANPESSEIFFQTQPR